MTTVRYLVDDVEASVAFYTERLGFALDDQMGSAFAVVTRGDLQLWLSGHDTSAARPMPDGRRPVAGGWNRFVVEVDDLVSLVADLRAHGVAFRNDIVSGPGGKQILLDDPSGNPIELFEGRG